MTRTVSPARGPARRRGAARRPSRTRRRSSAGGGLPHADEDPAGLEVLGRELADQGLHLRAGGRAAGRSEAAAGAFFASSSTSVASERTLPVSGTVAIQRRRRPEGREPRRGEEPRLRPGASSRISSERGAAQPAGRSPPGPGRPRSAARSTPVNLDCAVSRDAPRTERTSRSAPPRTTTAGRERRVPPRGAAPATGPGRGGTRVLEARGREQAGRGREGEEHDREPDRHPDGHHEAEGADGVGAAGEERRRTPPWSWCRRRGRGRRSPGRPRRSLRGALPGVEGAPLPPALEEVDRVGEHQDEEEEGEARGGDGDPPPCHGHGPGHDGDREEAR